MDDFFVLPPSSIIRGASSPLSAKPSLAATMMLSFRKPRLYGQLSFYSTSPDLLTQQEQSQTCLLPSPRKPMNRKDIKIIAYAQMPFARPNNLTDRASHHSLSE
jgi:hypothetical protein